MNNQMFQDVFDKLQDYLPNDWKKVLLFAAYTTGSYSMKYYVDCGDGSYKDCFHIPGISKAQLVKLFIGLDKILSVERKTLEENQKWSVLTMRVDDMGAMETEFDYVDLSENMIAYEQEWKAKYIG